MVILQCDYGNMWSFMREKRMIKQMILAKCNDMNASKETSPVGIIFAAVSPKRESQYNASSAR